MSLLGSFQNIQELSPGHFSGWKTEAHEILYEKNVNHIYFFKIKYFSLFNERF